MTKAQEYQSFSNYLGMTPKSYVARGLAIKRVVEGGHSFEGTEVGVGGAAPRGSVTSPSSLPTQKPKRPLTHGERFNILRMHQKKRFAVERIQRKLRAQTCDWETIRGYLDRFPTEDR